MISVIIPVHNGEKFLNKCIDSILGNTYRNLEVILVENASTDRTLEICQQYKEKDERVRVISTPKAGVSHARNLGLDVATGEYITFADADDYVSSYLYQVLLECAEKMDGDFVFCDCIMGSHTNYSFPLKENNCAERMELTQFYHDTYMHAQTIYSSVCNKLIAKKCVGDVRFDESLQFVEDRNFIIRCVCKARNIVKTEQILYYYLRGNQDSICSNSDLRVRMDQVYSVQKDILFFKINYPQMIEWQEFANTCLMQTADFRLKRAKENGLSDLEAILKPIISEAVANVRHAKHLTKKEKNRFLIEHYCPRLFQFMYKFKNTFSHGS